MDQSDSDEYEGDLRPIRDELNALREILGEDYRQIVPDDVVELDLDHIAVAAVVDQGPFLGPAPLQRRIESLTAAIEANATLQQHLQRLLASVEYAQDKAADIRLRVEQIQKNRRLEREAPRTNTQRKMQENYTGSSWYWALPNAPPPPQYPGADGLKAVAKELPLVFQRAAWTEDERKLLCDGILQLVQERAFDQLLSEMESAGGGFSVEELKARGAPIEELTLASPEVEQTVSAFTNSDWESICHRSLKNRTPFECRLQWFNWLRSSHNKEPFSAAEDARLMQLVQQHGTHAWDTVATLLSGLDPSSAVENKNILSRTALDCLARYQHMQSASKATREITQEELERLVKLVREHGSSWQRIAAEFGGAWTSPQLMHHWRRYEQRNRGGAVAPRKGRWDPEEDDLLHKAVALHGRKWSIVAPLVPGRTDVQCRERYMNILAPEVRNLDKFTTEEDTILMGAVGKCTTEQATIKWSKVAEYLPGRTDRQVMKRYVLLTGGNRQKAARKPKKATRLPVERPLKAVGQDHEKEEEEEAQPMLSRSGRHVKKPRHLDNDYLD